MRIPRRSYRGLPCLWLGNPSLSLGTVQGMYEWTYGILRTYIPIIVLARTDVCVPNATVVERCTVDPSDQSGILSSPRSRFGYITTIFFLVSPLYLCTETPEIPEDCFTASTFCARY